MAEEQEITKINVVVKTSKNKETIEIEPNATIKEFKEVISGKFSASVAQLCLIFAGRILKDDDTLESNSIKDGLTVHLVIKSENRAQQQAASHAAQASNPPSAPSTVSQPPVRPTGQQPSTPAANPFDLAGLGGLGLGGGMGSGNFQEMTQQLQQQMLTNPDMMRQIMDNPIVQGMMSNPELMRQMILGNPQMQQLVERNPEISHILNNPDLMRQTMEMARNPALMQEMMRNQDRALSNLESLPGGFNALQRMYTDIQEPMMNAAQEQMQQMQSNPFAALFGQGGATTGSSTPTTNSTSASNPQIGTENQSPLPNPWAAPGARQNATPSATTPTTTQQTSTTPSTGTNAPPSTNPLLSGMFQTTPLQNLMTQMSSNPQMMQQMMQSPYMQQMMQQMVQNPELMTNMLRTNPMFQGNPQLAEQVAGRLPEFMTQMQNPLFQQSMTNPRVLQAMMQVQQGLQQLQAEAPGLLPGIEGVGTLPQTTPITTRATTDTATTTTTATTATPTTGAATTTTPSPGSIAPPNSTPTAAAQNPMAQLMSQMMSAPPNPTPTATVQNPMAQLMSQMMSAPPNPTPTGGTGQDSMAQLMSQMMSVMAQNQNQTPEVQYQTQLERLAAMGFMDRQRNIQALVATGGDLNAAIERLLQ